MSNLIDQILLEVCLDPKIHDGIFKLNDNDHMDTLREYLVNKWGLTKENAIQFSNQMLEGRFPERQAYNADGILVTFPTPKHKAKAIARGTHFEKNPKPQPEPTPEPENPEPTTDISEPTPEPENPAVSPSNPPIDEPSPKSVTQGDSTLFVEPVRGPDIQDTPPTPPMSPVQEPDTPEKRAAEKAVAKQIMASDSLTEEVKEQIKLVQIFAETKGYTHVKDILSQYLL